MIVWNTKVREIEVDGCKVEVHDFGYASYYYPSFNRNAEFKVSKKGWLKLRHYLRLIKWVESQMPVFNF